MEKIIVLIGIAWLAQNCFAESKLVEIDRVGQTKSIHLHYIEERARSQSETKPKRLTAEEIYEKILPIHTPGMSPGIVSSRTINLPSVLRPVFIIGSDEMSMKWLRKNKTALVNTEALGLLVEVETIDQLKVMGRLASGLQIAPSSGQYIVETLGVTNYPVLITSNGIEQ